MGSYSHISFDDYPIFSVKNSYVNEIVDSIFLPEDYIEETRLNNSRNEIAWGRDFDDCSEYVFSGFSQTVKICKQRLEIFGNCFLSAKNDFDEAKIIANEEYTYNFPINKATYKNYLLELKNIITNKDKNYDDLYGNLRESLIAGELIITGQSLQSV